ncbi:MAG: SAM-dependent DNA methyltransferase [Kiritimatiellae bacterium]|nr:SAM-dependent DNA methyltransferase [Bacteroidales bacterium]MBR3583864.1 SAM-dependent DNA methyltransferase [Kiritimatiellia bacterium]
MAIKKSQLYSKLWQACDELRGGMDASQYKDYVLVLLFIKYISDRAKSGDGGLLIDLPEGCTFGDLVAFKGSADIGERMNKVLERIGGANKQLADTITSADFADEQKLGKGKDLVETVSNLIGIFQDKDLDLSSNRAADDDLIGDAYEYLMKNFATQSGKSKGQFYTPGEVSRLMAQIVDIAADTRPMISIYDMACGSGSLLIRAAVESGRPFDRVAIEGQEKDLATIGMAKMSMVIHGIDDAELKHGNTLTDPQHRVDDTRLRTFDYCFANPPFSLKGWMKGAQENDPFGRWGHGGGVAPVPPPKCGDYAFLLHMVASLKSRGRAAIILPHGVLFRGHAEAAIRKFLVEKRIVSGIIGLPPNLFFGTGIPACIIVLDKGAAPASKGIFMIDAKEGYAKDGAKNRLRECDIRRIVDAWKAHAGIPHYARMVEYGEIEGNDYSLNLPRYIVPADREVRQDLAGHIRGGIPEADAAACPAVLFEPLREGYVRLAGSADEVAANLDADPVTGAAAEKYRQACTGWLGWFKKHALAIGQGNRPKELIAEWSGRLLQTAKECGTLVDAYDVYEILMEYWAETMQDDCYLVSRDGWKAELQPPARKRADWKNYVCDLLPVEIVARDAFAAELAELGDLGAKLEETAARMDEIDARLAEEEPDEEFDEEAAAAERKELDKKAKSLRKSIKEANGELADKLTAFYAAMTPEDVRTFVVERKWMPTLEERFSAELARVKASIVADVQALAFRYAATLPEAAREVAALEKKVAEHLAAMGIEL